MANMLGMDLTQQPLKLDWSVEVQHCQQESQPTVASPFLGHVFFSERVIVAPGVPTVRGCYSIASSLGMFSRFFQIFQLNFGVIQLRDELVHQSSLPAVLVGPGSSDDHTSCRCHDAVAAKSEITAGGHFQVGSFVSVPDHQLTPKM